MADAGLRVRVRRAAVVLREEETLTDLIAAAKTF
ncbi:hypothetical protein EDD75_1611 [Thermodesulfitimonas autotrophica]|uniref:Uncharacterized protein n=1 Tax=Thermodesulfitimonas autotrophica TaxID=1894989 RepID=A0A3N5AEX9_9THEO|nr:hypothetical protein EDD75_1611 [Thermodesulfitimonas autotrophica]